jgi:hypothetical protein
MMNPETTFSRTALGVLGAAALCLLISAGPAAAATTTTQTATFTAPGLSQFVVPDGVSSITITAVGAAGAACSTSTGGEGASIGATVPVTGGEQLIVGVGGAGGACLSGPATDALPGPAGGPGGGGAGGGIAANSPGSTGSGGGGASLVGLASPSLGFGPLLVVAGGGGGAGGPFDGSGGNAGAAGTGMDNGSPGTVTAGGAGGSGLNADTGDAGSSGVGGAGGSGTMVVGYGGGGGGGGYFGGGGAAGSNTLTGAGGGGGSSFSEAPATDVSAPRATTAAASVTITYLAPTVAQSTGTLAFSGTQPLGVASASQSLTVTDSGSAPLTVSAMQLSGADPDDFVITDGCQQPIAAGASCSVDVRFSPEAQGARSATLTLVTDAENTPAPVALSGTGGSLPQGAAGPAGATGATGKAGTAGKVELVTCTITHRTVIKRVKHRRKRVVKKIRRCTTKLVSGPVTFKTS